MDKWIAGWMDGSKDGWVDDGWLAGCMVENGQMEGVLNRGINKWMENKCADGWIN